MMKWKTVQSLTVLGMLPALFGFLPIGCDPEGRRNCDWVIEAEPDNIDKVDTGFIPVCARNRVTMKQDCRLQTTLEQAKAFYERKFRYNDLKVDSPGIPRTITSITFCDDPH